MSDAKNKKTDTPKEEAIVIAPPEASTPSELGKQWRGQRFAPIMTSAQLAEIGEVQKKYNKPDAVSIEVYFAHKKVRDPVSQAGMLAYTVVRKATIEDWNTIFANY